MKLKKPKFWDYEKPNLISNILFPISKIFEIFANIKKRKTNIKNIKTICVEISIWVVLAKLPFQ